jgi:hypothetical protein
LVVSHKWTHCITVLVVLVSLPLVLTNKKIPIG